MDIISFSARDEDQIKVSFNNYIQSSEKLIVSRAINSQELSKELLNKITLCKNKHVSLIARLQEMLELSTSKYVFLAADDDYIMKDNLGEMVAAMEADPNSASGISITCIADINLQDKSITISPYLNSPLIRSKVCQSKNLETNSAEEWERIIYENFLPLSVDFYSIYKRNKLKCIVKHLLGMNDDSILEISRTNKLLQFILAYAVLLTGTLPMANKPIYIRGNSVPMRADNIYMNKKVVTLDERMSFAEELSIFFKNKVAWNDVVNALNCIYKEYGHQSYYRLSLDDNKRREQIEKGLRLCFDSTLFSLKTRLLDLYKQNYSIALFKSRESKSLLIVNNDSYKFNIDLVKTKWVSNVTPFTRAWPGFLYTNTPVTSWEKLYEDQINEL